MWQCCVWVHVCNACIVAVKVVCNVTIYSCIMSLPVLQAVAPSMVAQDVEVEDEESMRQCLQKVAADSYAT